LLHEAKNIAVFEVILRLFLLIKISACTAQLFFTLTASPPGKKWASFGKADISLTKTNEEIKNGRTRNIID